MKSVKMFGKKILIVLLATMLLVSTAAIAVSADTQTVTGTTIIPYTVTTPVPFGSVVSSTTATVADIITASSDGNTITVTAVTPAGTNTNILETLKYVAGTVPPISGVPLPIWNDDTPVTTWVAIVLGAGGQLSLEALTGAVAGAWPEITITFTVT